MNLPATAPSKICKTCSIEQPLDNFYRDLRYKDQKSYRCKSCHNNAGAKYREKNVEHIREYKAKYKYGLDQDEYNKLKETTHCPICGSEEPLVIDHDHSTSKVRGLICQPCNKGLGFFRDNIQSLENAIKYLEQ